MGIGIVIGFGVTRRFGTGFHSSFGPGTVVAVPHAGASDTSATSGHRPEAVYAIYTADRSEISANISTISNITVAMMTYVAATLALISIQPNNVPSWLWVLVPAPAWALFYFQLVMFSMMAARTRSTLILERQVMADANLTSASAKVGLRSAELLTNVNVQPLRLKVVGVLPYAFVLLGLAAYSAVALTVPELAANLWTTVGVGGVYGLLFLGALGALSALSPILRESGRLARGYRN